jgi:quinol monooxygenase YgiN
VAVAVHICPDKMSKAEYERVIKDLEDSGVGEPEGRTFHAAYGGDQVCMFEVWDSAEHFDAHRGHLMEKLQAAGVNAGVVDVHPLHSDHPD